MRLQKNKSKNRFVIPSGKQISSEPATVFMAGIGIYNKQWFVEGKHTESSHEGTSYLKGEP